MRIIALIILIFGVALAGGAVFFASDRFDKLQATLQQQAAAVQPAARFRVSTICLWSRSARKNAPCCCTMSV